MDEYVPTPEGQLPPSSVVSGGLPPSWWSSIKTFIAMHKLLVIICGAVIVLGGSGATVAVLLAKDNKPHAPTTPNTTEHVTSNPNNPTDTATGEQKPADQPAAPDANKKPTGGTSGGQSNGGGTGSGGSSGGGGSSGSSTRCPAYPSFPDASCTGPVGSLSTYSGSLDFYADNQVVENVIIHLTTRGIYLAGDNVTFRNVKVVWDGAMDGDFTMINVNNVSGAVFENCEFDGKNNIARAISGDVHGAGITVKNCNIHNTGNGVEATTPMLIEDNYIHDIFEPTPNPSDWHADGLQTTMGDDNVTVRHNNIYMKDPSTSAINMQGTAGNPASNVLIEYNLLSGGGYTLYAGYGDNYRVLNNHLSTREFSKVGAYGIWYWDPSQDGDVLRQGNVIHETGAPANDNI